MREGTMKVNVIFDYSLQFKSCGVSKDIFRLWDTEEKFANVTLPSYEPLGEESVVVAIHLREGLPLHTIQLPAIIFKLHHFGPEVNFCYLHVNKKLPKVLDVVAISLNGYLFDKLLKLSHADDKLKFLQIKYGLQNLSTVVWNGFTLAPSLCTVSYCSPNCQGLVDFMKTQIVFVKEKVNASLDPKQIVKELTSPQTANLTVRLRSLKYPVPSDIIRPEPSPTDDDSIFAFATFETLTHLSIASGSYAEITDGSVSRVVKLFVFVNPNKFKSHRVYTHPRIIAVFPDDSKISVKKYATNLPEVQIASSVSISRVGCWNQCQKVFQNIILNNLRNFLTSKKRVLHQGDMVPITFDSSLAALCDEEYRSNLPFTRDDKLVWFYIEGFESEQLYVNNAPEFVIDPNKTRLVTANIVSKAPLKRSRCDYVSYYGLEPTFDYDLSVFPYAQKIIAILNSFMNCYRKDISINTSVMLHSSNINTGKSTLVRYAALNLGFHLIEIDCLSLTAIAGLADSTPKTLGYLKAKLDNVIPYTKPAVIYIAHLDILFNANGQDPDSIKSSKSMDIEIANLIEEMSNARNGTFFIGSVNNIDCIPQNVRNSFIFDIDVPIPAESQRHAIFRWLLSPSLLNQNMCTKKQRFCMGEDISISKLAEQTAGLTPLDIKKIVLSAKYCSMRRSKGLENPEEDEVSFYISMEDLSFAISKTRDEFSASIGAPKIPRVTWNDIGGMDVIHAEIMDTIELPLKHPELFASGMKKRSGILFYGPPGTGKTLMAKAIATNFSLNFFSVKGPELLNMYIGESEANVRRVFQKARDAKPCVIFFDELDSVAPKRGNQGDSGGVMDRIVSQLLAELDSMGSDGEGIFVIGATNRPDLLDEALLRPGRFDKLLYLGIADTDEKQLDLLRALTRKFPLGDVDLLHIARQCPFTYTGADFYALCSDSMLYAMSRTAAEVDSKLDHYNKVHHTSVSLRYWFDRIAEKKDISVTVEMVDFVKAQRELIPSVSEDELAYYLKVKSNFEKT